MAPFTPMPSRDTAVTGWRAPLASARRPIVAAAQALDGLSLPGLPGLAYAFQPLPSIRLATVLYPGDEEFSARGIVLFDAAASHYLPTDGLALLGLWDCQPAGEKSLTGSAQAGDATRSFHPLRAVHHEVKADDALLLRLRG